MARPQTQTKSQTVSTNSRRTEQRKPFTLELARQLCPHEALAENLTRTFGPNTVDSAGIREATEEHFASMAKLLEDNLNEKAMAMHLQRVVGAFVISACGAGQFYSSKVTVARELTTRLSNDDRDEDRGGPSGFDDRAARARQFAGETGLQAHALLCAAEGAVSAFAHITGDEWKPYEAPISNTQTVNRQSAAAEIAAFGA